MKQNDAKFNTQTKSGTFLDKVHHGEVKRNAKFHNDAPAAINQNLAASKGVAGAMSILSGQYKKGN